MLKPSCAGSLTGSVMRRRMLQALDRAFRNYLLAFAVMWLVGIASALVTILLLRVPGPFWLHVVTTTCAFTIACFVDIALIRVLKALFHERVLRALADRESSRA